MTACSASALASQRARVWGVRAGLRGENLGRGELCSVVVLGTDVLADNEPLILEVPAAPSSSTVSSMLTFPQGPLERRHVAHLTSEKEIILFF